MTTPTLAQDRPAAASLANAEFTFASRSVATDMREAFLSVLSEDAILLRPGPVKAREAMTNSPAPPIELNWRPAFVHVAASGELGYSTGPARITSKADASRPPRFTNFVSIWKRDTGNPGKLGQPGDGPWKLYIDLGINHPQPALADAWLELSAGSGNGAGEAAFLAAESGFSALVEKSGYAAAFADHASKDVRVYREGAGPILGKAALNGAALLPPGSGSEVVASGVAKSGDLGFALVRLAPRKADGTLDKTTAHALRVWRVRDGKFELALDIVNDMPKP